MFSRIQSKKGGRKTQIDRQTAANYKRKLELAKMAEEHGGYAKISFHEEDTLQITTGTLKGKVFFTDTQPEAIFNDGTIINGNPWFLED